MPDTATATTDDDLRMGDAHSDVVPVPNLGDEILVEEVSIDGMCGVY